MDCLGRKIPPTLPYALDWTLYTYMDVNSFPTMYDLHCEVHVVAVARQKTAHTTLNTSINLIQPSLYICM